MLLTVEDLRFSYGKGERELFGGLSFSLPKGAFLGVLGANGSGKSALMDLLAGLESPKEGKVLLDGSEDDLLKNAALLPENPDHFILGATPREELLLGLRRAKELLKDSEKRAEKNAGKETGGDAPLKAELLALAEKWSLSELLDLPSENLSRGQKKRLALASALAGRPKIFLFDEPFSGLDYPGILSLKKDLALLKKEGLSSVIVTHEPGLTAELMDYWLLIRPGRTLFVKETDRVHINSSANSSANSSSPSSGSDSLKGPLDAETLMEFGVRPF
jgi:biotin transport system ATP-binding protein